MKPFEGQPIKPDVDKLMDNYKLVSGNAIDHRDIAHVAGVAYPSARYTAIISSWRRRLLREQNIDIQCIVGFGYRVLEDNERVAVGIKDFSASVRQMGRSADRIDRADSAKLDDMHRRQKDHAVRLTQEIVGSGRKAAKEIGFAGRVIALPTKIPGKNSA